MFVVTKWKVVVLPSAENSQHTLKYTILLECLLFLYKTQHDCIYLSGTPVHGYNQERHSLSAF